MQRRTLLGLGAVAGTMLALAGGALAWLQPAFQQGVLTEPARVMMSAVAGAVLGDALPLEGAARRAALASHLDRLQAALNGLPPALLSEVDQLFTVLCHPAGRLGLAGLAPAWADANSDQVSQSLLTLRRSSLPMRRQAYRALRDLTNSAYFAGASTWPTLGYPGARPV